ncbi:MAG TPA: efflux RND transporter periplasmic adaptor subunit [Patescibacteria group bacterium]|nr:efflux RND transporter periplasmic adaptor subunit [Patescibacteria group bacterium]
MKNKGLVRGLGIVIVISIILIAAITLVSTPRINSKTQEVAAKSVAQIILADGKVVSQNEAKLSFQTGGKLTYLPFKEGDSVSVGQTIASLDTYALQRQLQLVANTYQTTKNNTDQAVENSKSGITEGQQRTSLDTTNKNGYSNYTEAQVITDAVQRIVDNNLLAQNSAQINMDIANYALSLATLTSPMTGIITHEDVTVPNVNITPLTSFTIDDPNSLVFRANVDESDIDYVTVGSSVKIHLNGVVSPIPGTVLKVYPQKTTLASGQDVYQVDIQATSDLKTLSKLGQGGSVEIKSNLSSDVVLVPTWTVLNGQYVWIDNGGRKEMKKVSVGRVHGGEVEILDGLGAGDAVIINPESIIANSYSIL